MYKPQQRKLGTGETVWTLRAYIAKQADGSKLIHTKTIYNHPDTAAGHQDIADFLTQVETRKTQLQHNTGRIQTVGDLVDHYLDNPPPKWTTYYLGKKRALNRDHVKPWPIAARRYDDPALVPRHFEQHINTLTAASRDSRNKVKQLLFNAYEYAALDGMWKHQNPLGSVRIAGAARRETKLLTPAQAQDVFRIIVSGEWNGRPVEHFAASLALGVCGLRPGEAAGIRWESVNFDGGYLDVTQAVKVDGETVDSPKNRRGVRVVPLPELVAVRLREWEEQSTVLGCGRRPDYVLFDDRRGSHDYTKPVPPERLSGRFKRRFPGCHVYQLRHWAVSFIRAGGIDAADAAAVAGHSIEVANDHYVKALGRDFDRIADLYAQFEEE